MKYVLAVLESEVCILPSNANVCCLLFQSGLTTLLKLKVPVSLLYGELDTIMPYHQGECVKKLARGKIRCYVVEGAWHMPHLIRDGEDFCAHIRHAHVHNIQIHEHGIPLSGKLHADETWREITSTYVLPWTMTRILSFYDDLLGEHETKEDLDSALAHVVAAAAENPIYVELGMRKAMEAQVPIVAYA